MDFGRSHEGIGIIKSPYFQPIIMSKKFNLTIGERYAALTIFDAFKGSISELSTILDDVKNVTITFEEWKKAGRKFLDKSGKVIADEKNIVDADGKSTVGSISWNESDKATWKDVELDKPSVDYILKTIKEKSDKNELTLADGAIISLQKKLI